ncbi:MAG: hypothetical protein LBM25_01150 [Bacteroidales bacterium]|jgi:hypothetical protein|nr:hypothetical protein [Bacteroidales bacterium]
MKRIIVLSLFVLITSLNVFCQQEKRTVAVTPTLGSSVSDDVRMMIYSGLEEGVYRSGNYKVVARGVAYEQALKEFNFQNSGAVDDSKLVEFGRASGAELVCFASINKITDQIYRISYKLIDVKTAEILNVDSKTIKNGIEGVVDATDAISEELFGKKTINTPTKNNVDAHWKEMLRIAVSTNSTQLWGTGDKYKGQLKNGYRTGFGIYSWEEVGDFYIGSQKEGYLSGYGISIMGQKKEERFIFNCPNCVCYVGEWSKGKKHGTGACYDKNGYLIYYGNFENDIPTQTYPSSTTDSKKRFGVLIFANGNNYIGEYYEDENTKQNHKQGWGAEIHKDGNILFANWKGNNGSNGCVIFSSGTISEGYWKNGEFYKK